ncbi:thioredoxin fold domain-containing protein [Antarcticibacterium sp. 1MA-6-2]|uniref:thioredoxin family protein n=1 Tax=Antarcticibacterium sp. 1MA-6-2 TaxID=2908210 RepID=UPI001F2BA0DD|nr:thioredoxin fold domain-containing protein [Antarcticibacterium sp. 1MA-6-2]UJH89831.1 thioredoxin fold domain-containing protein [Antarcticibacterium sp. 1MA-6-2]
MKLRYFAFFFFLALGVSQAQEIKWMSMNEALAAQKKAPKKILMDAYTDWCGPCKLMDQKTFTNKDVVNYVNKHFYAVKFNAEGTEEVMYRDFNYTNPNYDPNRKGRNSQHFFANALKINGYPSLVFFDEQSNVIAPIAGYRTPEQLEIYLKMIAKDDYKKLTTQDAWQEYEKNFKGSFKN